MRLLLFLFAASVLLGCVHLRPRSGDPALDEIVRAVTGRDADRVAALIATKDVPCVASRVGPPCTTGQDVGIAVPAFPLSNAGRGTWWVRVDADDGMDVATKSRLASEVIGARPHLGGVVRLRTSLDGAVEADTLVFIAQPEGGVKLFVRDGRIVGLMSSAVYPPDFALWYENAARDGTVLIGPPR